MEIIKPVVSVLAFDLNGIRVGCISNGRTGDVCRQIREFKD